MLKSPIVMKIIEDNNPTKNGGETTILARMFTNFVIRTGTLKCGGYVDVLIGNTLGNTSIHTQERFRITHLEQSFESFS
jgi:hypothetical protein